MLQVGHSDQECPDKMHNRYPSMSDWTNKIICAKYKTKGHFAFNYPPKYNNKIRKIPQKKPSPSITLKANVQSKMNKLLMKINLLDILIKYHKKLEKSNLESIKKLITS